MDNTDENRQSGFKRDPPRGAKANMRAEEEVSPCFSTKISHIYLLKL